MAKKAALKKIHRWAMMLCMMEGFSEATNKQTVGLHHFNNDSTKAYKHIKRFTGFFLGYNEAGQYITLYDIIYDIVLYYNIRSTYKCCNFI